MSPTELKIRDLQCQQCGQQFRCGSGGRKGGCWCMDQPHGLPLPSQGDCYCPQCLSDIVRTHGMIQVPANDPPT
ncbi:cysteine-rich CWC family protein [Deefgea salmonis]|uniref:Cysteine-rich CWC family protein n=1 Tax=Deefgea salmonis TaxID=2875502 RepID=A0ABS8BNH3_9NEIS|nr:cysteine-rich CWC family protein [Deefgea salmonis]MCB5197289.1 cysteine-rich CWC family protein [Deefgea salmonis]